MINTTPSQALVGQCAIRTLSQMTAASSHTSQNQWLRVLCRCYRTEWQTILIRYWRRLDLWTKPMVTTLRFMTLGMAGWWKWWLKWSHKPFKADHLALCDHVSYHSFNSRLTGGQVVYTGATWCFKVLDQLQSAKIFTMWWRCRQWCFQMLLIQ